MKNPKLNLYFLIVISTFFVSCKSKFEIDNSKALVSNYNTYPFSKISFKKLHDTMFVNIAKFSSNIILDMKYATTNNFLKEKVYDCATCLLRVKTIKSLLKANEDFIKKGYKIKIFDCYRPLDVQKKMWEIVPNANYVANPKKGSIHNRGGAVDLTIVDLNGNVVDMGTDFDFFGPESSHFYTKLDSKILENRNLLKKIMLQNGFESFDSEWWHYNSKGAKKQPISNYKWSCTE